MWKARLEGLRDGLIELEEDRRALATPVFLEEKFTAEIDGLALQARADRIDRTADGTLILCDYKTGAAPGKTAVLQGYRCQLSLLALMMAQPVERLDYLELKGGRNKPKPVSVEWSAERARETREGLAAWTKLFLEGGSPFLSLADLGGLHAEKAQDYLHLARHQEWGTNA